MTSARDRFRLPWAAVPARRLVVVAGPTGSGKSELAVQLAHRLDGEVVNADSMQLYRGMDIGTAKIGVADRSGVPHHLLDVLTVRQPASVAAYQLQARPLIQSILAAGRTPILVGGSGLYLTAVIDGIDFPGTDPGLRAYWEDRLEEAGVPALHAELGRRDPAAAAAIEPGNGRRIVRALEVLDLTGRPFAATLPTPGPPHYDAALLLLDRATPDLDEALAERVHAMMAAGFLDEVRTLAVQGLREGPTASRAVGYRQLLQALDGRIELTQAVSDTITATRRLVRRQRSWFGRDARWAPIRAGQPDTLEAALQTVRSF